MSLSSAFIDDKRMAGRVGNLSNPIYSFAAAYRRLLGHYRLSINGREKSGALLEFYDSSILLLLLPLPYLYPEYYLL